MSIRAFLPIVLALFFLPQPDLAALMARCGDCFCAPGQDGVCPTDETGIRDGFDEETETVLESFQLANSPSFLQLQSSGGGSSCYPFAATVGTLNNAPQTQQPACVIPTRSTSTSVCAFKFNPEDTACTGREYEIDTYPSEEDAVADGAVVTHTGDCGVCSSAQDWFVRIQDLDDFESNSVLCATSYTLSQDSNRFERLVNCYTGMGLTTPCATLWAHSGAASAILCSQFCVPDSTGLVELNGDPPSCEKSACLVCSESFEAEFDLLAGRTLTNSGVTERIIHPCSDFARIEHDYCVGTTELGTAGPTPAPAPTGESAAVHPWITISSILVPVASMMGYVLL